jgi:hypothetical protein
MSATILLILRLLLAASLYAFLAWGIYILWQDLRRQSQVLGTRTAPSLSLTHNAHVYRFTTPEVVIGRDPVCDLHMPDRTISAQHTRLTHHHGQWWVEDLHSTNGTYLNNQPVTEPLVITSQDELRCGTLVFQLQIGSAEPQADGLRP